MLYQLARALHASDLPQSEVLPLLLQAALDVTGCCAGCIVSVTPQPGHLQCAITSTKPEAMPPWHKWLTVPVLMRHVNAESPVILPLTGHDAQLLLMPLGSSHQRYLLALYGAAEQYTPSAHALLGEIAFWAEQSLHQTAPASAVSIAEFKAELSAMAYHDMRGPLQNIQSALVLLERLLGDVAGPVWETLNAGRANVARLSRMVESLLDIQRIEAGLLPLHAAAVPLAAIMQEVETVLASFAEDMQVQIVFSIASDLPVVYVDQDMIVRVVLNLLDNAIKHAGLGSQVWVTAAVQVSDVVICVADNGPGIAAEMRTQIFHKYRRRKKGSRGLGLGLAFCRMAVEAHGGQITVESSPGQGAMFRFTLPLEPTTQHAGVG